MDIFKEMDDLFKEFKKDADRCIEALKKAQKSSEKVKEYLTKHGRSN